MSRWLRQFFTELNVTHEYHEIESGRGNVIAHLPGDPNRPTVLLDAHQDTVPTFGMTIDPFDPAERKGRLYGRGACDVKGAMASILATIARLQADGHQQHCPIIVSCTCDEERGQKGAKELVRRMTDPAEGTILACAKPSMAIVSEPTDLHPVIAHKGTARWKVQTSGIAAHSSNPSGGINAIYKMTHVIQAFDHFSQQLSLSGTKHALCGYPTLSVGTVSGGTSVNIVPDRCLIEIDRRVIPGELPQATIDEAQRELSDLINVDFEFLPPDTLSHPLVDGENRAVAEKILVAAGGVLSGRQIIGVPFTTHAPRIASLDIPTIVFGPGSIAQAHTEDEWIEIEQLEQASEILMSFLSQ